MLEALFGFAGSLLSWLNAETTIITAVAGAVATVAAGYFRYRKSGAAVAMKDAVVLLVLALLYGLAAGGLGWWPFG